MTTPTPSPTRQIGHEPMPPINHDLGEVTANYPVGALLKGTSHTDEAGTEVGPDTLDFMLNQFKKDYIANASTEPNDLLRDKKPPDKIAKKKRTLLDRLVQLPSVVLMILSLAAGGFVALLVVGIALIALRLNL